MEETKHTPTEQEKKDGWVINTDFLSEIRSKVEKIEEEECKLFLEEIEQVLIAVDYPDLLAKVSEQQGK